MKRRGFVTLAAAIAVALQLATAAGAAAQTRWIEQDSGTANDLYGLSCPTELTCYAVGAAGTVRVTTDAGRTWKASEGSVGGSPLLRDISCASATQCVVVGFSGVVRYTLDGGRSWSSPAVNESGGWSLTSVSCATATACTAVGGNGVAISTLDAGRTWKYEPTGATGTTLWGVSCPAAAECLAVGDSGTVASKRGTTWTRRSLGAGELLEGIACPTANLCFAVGGSAGQATVARTRDAGGAWVVDHPAAGNGTLIGVSCPTPTDCWTGGQGEILATHDAGMSWSDEGVTPNAPAYYEVSCADAANCWADATGGVIVTNAATAQCTSGGAGAPPACMELDPPGPVPSNDCDAAPQSVVLDGYVGSQYTRLRTKQSGSATWVCVRLQPEGGTEYAGGKFVLRGAGSPAGADTSGEACAQQSGYQHLTGGVIEGQPYALDAWAGDTEAWVCVVAAGLGARVRLSSGDGTLPFQQDNPMLAASPPRTSWPAGKSSAACDAQVTGTKTQLVDASLGGAQVWVTAVQQGAKTMLCYRAEQGSTGEGGRFTLDATGVPGVTPVLQTGSSTTGCSVTAFTNDTADVAVRRSANNDNPASVCVTVGSSTIRLTAGYTGALGNGNVEHRRD